MNTAVILPEQTMSQLETFETMKVAQKRRANQEFHSETKELFYAAISPNCGFVISRLPDGKSC